MAKEKGCSRILSEQETWVEGHGQDADALDGHLDLLPQASEALASADREEGTYPIQWQAAQT